MPQKARFKAIEMLRVAKGRFVVVSTDVAARGLDMPYVATVVHYDVPRALDTFVHRSGRTVRGVGEQAVGSSLSLVSPAEDKMHRSITASLGVSMSTAAIDGRLMTMAQERTNLASKIVIADEVEQRSKSNNQWFEEQAEAVGLELDEGLLEDDRNRPPREQLQLREARQARVELSRLLSQPMVKQRYGKFLSTMSAAGNVGVPATPMPSVGAGLDKQGDRQKSTKKKQVRR